MPFVCAICQAEPSSHSLKNLGTKNGVAYFYTRPAVASKYYDADGILYHYDGVLSEVETEWVWVIDSKGFTAKHLLEIHVAVKLASLIVKKYSKHLRTILVINPTWHVRTALEFVRPFLSKRVLTLIKFADTDEDDFSI